MMSDTYYQSKASNQRGMDLLPGAREYVAELRAEFQIVILSDTYYEFAAPFMEKLGWPTLFCNTLQTDSNNRLVDYHLRIRDGKRHAVRGFMQLNFRTVAIGDSYNDLTMLEEADQGILFRPSDKVRSEVTKFPIVTEYAELLAEIREVDRNS